jgi:putative heme-binding domain-containing protein
MRCPRLLSALFAAALIFTPVGLAQPALSVTMLTPGFTVRELPVKLTNVNNLRFTPGGKLTALGYDGRVHLLTDSDGDGLEDTATVFWDRQTISVPVGMAWSQAGLYVSSKGKVSLLRDTDGDGKADVEEIVASGWPATDVASGGVDATAVTLDDAGNVYFGLLTANYANPYRVKDGVSRYDLNSPRGTIQKWSVAAKQLETIATGIRVPYTLAFNRRGDLFVTDQEGATWLPGGNPLDELNHIVPGRNYGFPPRHDKHLPDLISESPVIGFGPQHQSACGFVFNESSGAQQRFGPADWEGDALVAGESRGKIWRARLVKTAGGYVGKETTIARLGLLVMDVAVSPAGDLYVACHTGRPDWGTGPNGQGKLFKISHADPAAPQPTAIWASAPQEISVAFDRPIAASAVQFADAIAIEFGDFVSSADRFEVLKPPYKSVQAQDAIARGKLRVVAARLSPDRRTVALTTDPQPLAVNYALTLPGVQAVGASGSPATVDLTYDLNGVEAIWTAGGAEPTTVWKGWLPHLNTDVNAHFTLHSARHERLTEFLRRPGRLQLRTQMTLRGGNVTLRLKSSAPFEASLGAATQNARQAADSFTAELLFPAASDGQTVPLAITLATGVGTGPSFEATTTMDTDPTVRAVPLGALLLPWAMPHRAPPTVETEKTNLAGGDFERGRALFYGAKAACATCHQVRGAGSTLGPDLSNLAHRDATSVLRDIKDPSATINPDYVGYLGQLKDGGGFTGFVRAQDAETLRVAGMDGKDQVVSLAEVTDLRPSPVSLMPPGLIDGLKESEVRDLLVFLTNAPPARSAADVAAVLRPAVGTAAEAPAVKPLAIVLVASKQDHGPGQHDYPAWQKQWQALLAPAAGLTVAIAWEWPTPEQWRTADAIVCNYRKKTWSAEDFAQLDTFQARGGGLVILHAATIVDKEPEQLAARLGLSAQPGPTKYRHMPVTLKFTAPAGHAITRGFKSLAILDEPYWPMFGDPREIQILATADIDGAARPLVWTFQKGAGRVFGSIPGHYTWTFDDPLFRILALRGLAWACGGPVARFEALE